jgi:hypothetical protein
MIERHPAMRFRRVTLADLVQLARQASAQGGSVTVTSSDGVTYSGFLTASRAALMAANERRVSNAA